MRNLNTIPLSALRTIETIGRTGSLGAAAAELGVTPGALSQRLTKAEAALGRPLFLRQPDGLQPTEACQAVLPRLSRAMRDLSGVVGDLSDAADSVLTVSVAPIFASRWLIWRIGQFTALNPHIRIRIEPKIDLVDLDHSEVDIGIRVGRGPQMGEHAVKLLDQKVFPVCSAEMAERVDPPEDLLRLPIIRENDALMGWDVWLAAFDLTLPRRTDGPTYADGALCLDAAMTGQGVFMAWETLACDALERGQLVAPFDTRVDTGAAYWFATGQASARKPAVRTFHDWLVEELDRSIRSWRKGRGG